MRFDVITLFPEMITSALGESIIGRAQKGGYIELHTHQLRDWSRDKHRRVDDTPYGGGMGMLIRPDPVCDCHRDVRRRHPSAAERCTCRRRGACLHSITPPSFQGLTG